MSNAIESWTLGEVAAAVNGEIINGRAEDLITGVTTDSRSIPPKSLFVALRGERQDAHRFLPAVAGAGARAAIVDAAQPTRIDFGLIRVADTTRALGDLAAAYRSRFRPRVAAITGTSGKTTTKDLLASILRRRFRTVSTTGNLNNHIGVPLTLFGLNRKTEKAVIEMGMSNRGEIARLAEIAAPNIGVITSIGPAHLDTLKNVEGVLDAKSELIEYLNGANGTVILDADQPYFSALASRVKCRLMSVGESPDAEIRISNVSAPTFSFRGIDVSLRIFGRHAISNAALAAATAEALGADQLDIVEGLRGYFPSAGRANRFVVGGVTIIDDAYNANPLSFAAALETLATSNASRRIVAMSDMLELGEDAAIHHAEIGKKIAGSGVDLLVWRGAMTEHAARACSEVKQITCATNAEMIDALRNSLRPGDSLLVKASHGMHLEEVVDALKARKTPGEVVSITG